MAHSEDVRGRVIKFIRQGGSKAEASRRYEIGLRTIHTWMGRGDDQKPRKPGPKGSSKIDMKKLVAMVGPKGTDRMRKEIRMRKEMAKELRVDQSTVSKALKRLGVSRKETRRYGEAKFYEKHRRRFLKRLYKVTQEQRDIVFVDETGFAPTMGRTHGWSFIGQKIYGDVPGNKRPRTGLIGG